MTEHMQVPNRSTLGLSLRYVVSSNLQPETLTFETTPCGTQPRPARAAQLLGRTNSSFQQSLLHRRTHATEVRQLQAEERVRQI